MIRIRRAELSKYKLCLTFIIFFISIAAFCQPAPPNVSIATPASNSSFLAGSTITIRINASDPNGSGPAGKIVKIEVYKDAIKLGLADSIIGTKGKIWRYIWTNVPAGTYQLTTKAFDNDGQNKISAIKTVTFHPPGFISNRKYYVKQGAAVANNGLSLNTPFPTIQKAADLVNPGDTVFVMNGTYGPGSTTFRRTGSDGHYIVFINYPGHKPFILFNSWSGFSFSDGGSFIELNGFKIQGNNANIALADALVQPGSCQNPGKTPDGKYNGSGITITGRPNESAAHPHHHRILNNEIFDCGTAGIATLETDYTYIINNKVYNNSWYTIYGGSGISLLTQYNADNTTGYRCIIKNNYVYGNKLLVPWAGPCKITDGNGIIIDTNKNPSNGLSEYTGRTLVTNNIVFNNGGSGIHAFQSNHVDIINNTSYHNSISTYPTGEVFGNRATDCYILNNIIIPLTNEPATFSGTGVTYDYNCIFDATPDKRRGKGVNDIYEDPQFVNPSIDPAVADFRLKPTSPLINKPTLNKAPTTDFLGIARPQGTGFEMGAYEYIPDVTAPSIPGNLTSTSQSTNSISLKWDNSTDNLAIAGYNVYKGGVLAGTTNAATTSFVVTGLTDNTQYTFTVKAKDISGNISSASADLVVSTLVIPDVTPPLAPTNLTSPSQTPTSIDLSWTASTDNIGVVGYDIYLGDNKIGSTDNTSTTFTVTSLQNNTSYTFTVKARDGSDNVSGNSNELIISTKQGADVEAPSIPTSLSSATQTSTTVDLAWNASADNVGVTQYEIFKDGQLVGTTIENSFTVVDLDPSTTYTFTIKAQDAENNLSDDSDALVIATLTGDLPVVDIPSTNIKPRKIFSFTKDQFWQIEGMEQCTLCSVIIFTRSGSKVFETIDYVNTKWDGMFKGTRLMDGGYSYVIRRNGKNLKTGTITIIK